MRKRIHDLRQILAALAGAGAQVFASHATAASTTDPTVDPIHVCNHAKKTLNTGPLLRSLARTYHSSLTEDQIARILSNSTDMNDREIQDNPEVLDIAADTMSILTNKWSKSFVSKEKITTQQYYQYYISHGSQDGFPVQCILAEPTSLGKQQTGFRLRGTPDDLSISKTDSGFSGASQATISFSDDQTTKINTTQLEGAVGYAFATDAHANNVIVPYVAGNYNLSKTAGNPATYSSDTLDFGVQDVAQIALGTHGAATLSVAPDYLHDFQDNSSILSIHPIFAPTLLGTPINTPFALALLFPGILPAGDTSTPKASTYVTLLFDVRGDFGVYTDRGAPAVAPANRDFARVGSKFGIDIAKLNWFEFTATDVQLYGPLGSRRHVSDFESSFTFYFGTQNVLGLTASYKSGLIEQSLQKEQIWALGLTAKY